jgi:hypothetical protein
MGRRVACFPLGGDWVAFDHHFWARANDLPIPKVEIGHVRRRINQAQRAVQSKGFSAVFCREALGDDDLKDISCFDVIFGFLDIRAELRGFCVACIGEFLGSRYLGVSILKSCLLHSEVAEVCSPRHARDRSLLIRG